MPDRVVRDELLESDRWLDLPTDACRLAFVAFLLHCDDFGNFEGSPHRIFRILQRITQVKTMEASAATIDSLMACDLIRRYEVDGRELFHIPRFRSHRQYIVRKMPASPWDSDVKLGKTQRIELKGLAKDQEKHTPAAKLSSDVVTTSHSRSNDVAQGVGVGEGVNLKPMSSKPDVLPRENSNGKARNDEAREIIAFLNKCMKRNYQPVDANLKLARARLAEASLSTIKAVIATKCDQWDKDERMAEYLRPATLLNATKFAQYLGELPAELIK